MLRRAFLLEELDVPIHTHLHETDGEIAQGLAQHGMRPLERLRRLGVVGPRLVAVHAVHLDDVEIEILAREGASVAHCPSSNLKLASGFAPVAKLRAKGVNVGLGTDGAASNIPRRVSRMRTAARRPSGLGALPRSARRRPAHGYPGRGGALA